MTIKGPSPSTEAEPLEDDDELVELLLDEDEEDEEDEVSPPPEPPPPQAVKVIERTSTRNRETGEVFIGTNIIFYI